MNRVILDANYILAILDQDDIHHKAAIDIDNKIQAVFDEIFYFDCVMNEVVSLICFASDENGLSCHMS